MKNRVYIINPSELSYPCPHCQFLRQNYKYYNSGVSAGVTQTLDGMQKDFFTGDSKKIDEEIPDGTVYDPTYYTFSSIILNDNKDRPFRIRGKCDALIKFKDKEETSGIIDYKTSKYRSNPLKKKDSFKEEDIKKKINEYAAQLHGYELLYSNLDTNKGHLEKEWKNKYPNTKDKSKIIEGGEKLLATIKKIKIKKTSLMGLVFIYPYNIESKEVMDIKFSFKYFPIEIEKEKFRNSITSYIDMLEKKVPPPPPKDCGAKKCFAHKFFYNEKKLINEGERIVV